MAMIGIDLGTTNSLAAVWKDGKSVLIPNAFGDLLTPSAVSLDEDGTILVGKVAKERLISHPECSVTAFKRLMGTTAKLQLGEQAFSPEELSSFVLRRLKEDAEAYLGEPVTEAVISVPAYFNDNQRSATKLAAQLAGLHTERLVNEPSAAALACRFQDTGKDQSFLVFDFGGGTLDVSVVDCFDTVIEIAAVAGDNRLGGNDFDEAIARHFCKINGQELAQLSPTEQAILLKQAQLCKEILTHRGQAAMMQDSPKFPNPLLLNNKLLLEISAPFFQRMERVIARALTDGGHTVGEIDKVLLVGGSCHMPVVQSYIAHLLGREIARLGSPDTVVAQGVGVYAGIKARGEELKDIMMTDVCPFTLGVEVYSHEKEKLSHIAPMIERNSVLPVSVEHPFYTLSDNQKRITISVYQGEAYFARENLKLGELEVEVPPKPKGEEQVLVRFTYDINGILEVEVQSPSTKEKKRQVIVGQRLHLSQEEIDARLMELQRLKIHPADQEENRLVLARGERIYTESLGPVREQTGRCLAYLREAMDSQSPTRIRRAREESTRFFDAVEQQFLDGGLPFDFDPEDDEEDDGWTNGPF